MTPRRLLPAVLALLVLPACGLPLPGGVQEPGVVTAEERAVTDIQVLPPGPRADATPEEVVRGFLRAQSNADDRHAIARSFLTPEEAERWDDRSLVLVIDPDRREVVVDPTDPMLVVVTELVVGRIGGDGSYRLEGRQERRESYRLVADEAGVAQLASVPPGLRLSAQERDRTLRPYDVFFLGEYGQTAATAGLVADRVFLPVTEDPAAAVVEALVRGPSEALAGAVRTAVPPATTVRSVDTAAGVVTVDLSAEVDELAPPERARLSAQLVWTLRRGLGQAFSGLELRVDGRPLSVPGVDAVQDRADWAEYDPEGRPTVPAFYVDEGRLRSLDGGLVRSAATELGRLTVVEAAVSPSGRLGLVTAVEAGLELRSGPAGGPFDEVLAAGPGLSSLSWGSGEQGLWLLESGARPRVLLVPNDAGARPRPVPFEPPTGAGAGGPGPLRALRVSRDGARVAMVFGASDESRRLWVGRVEPTGDWVRIAGLRPVDPGLRAVADIAWESGTSLVLLARAAGSGIAPFRVFVDGSRSSPVPLTGLSGSPTQLAAAPGRPLVVATVLPDEGGRAVLYREDGALFREEGPGSAPFYPG